MSNLPPERDKLIHSIAECLDKGQSYQEIHDRFVIAEEVTESDFAYAFQAAQQEVGRPSR